VPASGIIPVSLGVLLVAVSFFDLPERAAQLYFSVAVIACCIALVWFALRRMAFWLRVAAIGCGESRWWYPLCRSSPFFDATPAI
jgi:ribose/xylose/arabinose/galactoside ABC-type transport system permease subunit